MLSTCANSTTSPISRFCGITGCLHGSYYDIYIYCNTTRALITKLRILHFVSNILSTVYKARAHCSGTKTNMYHLSKYRHYAVPDHLKYGVVTVRLWLDSGCMMVTEVSFMPATPFGTSGFDFNNWNTRAQPHNVDTEDVQDLLATTNVTVQRFMHRIYRYSISSKYQMNPENWTLVIKKQSSDGNSRSYKIVAADYLFVQLPAICMARNSEKFQLSIWTQSSMVESNVSQIEPGILQRGDTSYFDS